jgi:ATP-dependent NAD(P)H-hydrate dehydratase
MPVTFATRTNVKVILGSLPRSLIPNLNVDYHKGMMGRIGIIGGSQDYTGAPFYAAKASLNFGADLCYIFCAKQAAIPIKSYSPDAMVTPFYDADDSAEVSGECVASEKVEALAQRVLDEFLPRLHSLVIGPGLGRGELALRVTKRIIRGAVEANLPLVIDADGLFLVGQDLRVLDGCKSCVLTPNVVEFKRLVNSAIISLKDGSWDPDRKNRIRNDLQSKNTQEQLLALSTMLGVSIVLKGRHDLIVSPTSKFLYDVEEPAALRRCGGLGDVLAGSIGLALHWTSRTSNVGTSFTSSDLSDILPALPDGEAEGSNSTAGSLSESERVAFACLLASTVTRRASIHAFEAKGRSMCAVDVIDSIRHASDALLVEGKAPP